MMLIIGSVSLIMTAIDFIYPDPYYRPTGIDQKMRLLDLKKSNPQITQEDIEKQIAEENEQQELAVKRNRAKNAARNFSLFAVALPIYIYHWRKIQEENKKSKETT